MCQKSLLRSSASISDSPRGHLFRPQTPALLLQRDITLEFDVEEVHRCSEEQLSKQVQ